MGDKHCVLDDSFACKVSLRAWLAKNSPFNSPYNTI